MFLEPVPEMSTKVGLCFGPLKCNKRDKCDVVDFHHCMKQNYYH